MIDAISFLVSSSGEVAADDPAFAAVRYLVLGLAAIVAVGLLVNLAVYLSKELRS